MSHYHHTTPLLNSLNPIHFMNKLSDIKQIHYIGNKDKVVPDIIIKSFFSQWKKKFSNSIFLFTIIEVDATHQNKWEQKWPLLIK